MNDILSQLCDRSLAGGFSPEQLQMLLSADDDELRRCLAEADPRQQQQLAIRMSDCIRYQKSRSTLLAGLAIHLFMLATPEASRSEQIQSMQEETGISRTQQHRCRNAFLRFGRDLLGDAELASRFVPEATKRLSEPSTPETASYEALKRARGLEVITIKVANNIIARHKPKVKDEPDIETNQPSPKANSNGGEVQSGPDSPHQRVRRDEMDIAMANGINYRMKMLHESKAKQQETPIGQLVHEDNAVQIFARSVHRDAAPTTEELLFALQQACDQLRSSHPVQAMVADTYQSQS